MSLRATVGGEAISSFCLTPSHRKTVETLKTLKKPEITDSTSRCLCDERSKEAVPSLPRQATSLTRSSFAEHPLPLLRWGEGFCLTSLPSRRRGIKSPRLRRTQTPSGFFASPRLLVTMLCVVTPQGRSCVHKGDGATDLCGGPSRLDTF
jgi:hypothetical protein